MSEIEKLSFNLQYANNYSSRLEPKNRDRLKKEKAAEIYIDKFSRSKKAENKFIYQKPVLKGNKSADDLESPEELNAVQRPINIDENNNVFYINYHGENKALKIEPGEYSLSELSRAIQTKVNENFGIGKLKLDLTASGSDRLIKAHDKTIFDFLDAEQSYKAEEKFKEGV